MTEVADWAWRLFSEPCSWARAAGGADAPKIPGASQACLLSPEKRCPTKLDSWARQPVVAVDAQDQRLGYERPKKPVTTTRKKAEGVALFRPRTKICWPLAARGDGEEVYDQEGKIWSMAWGGTKGEGFFDWPEQRAWHYNRSGKGCLARTQRRSASHILEKFNPRDGKIRHAGIGRGPGNQTEPRLGHHTARQAGANIPG